MHGDHSSMSPTDLASPFVAQYIRNLVSDRVKWEVVLEELRCGVPFVEEEFLVIAIIDISGYSKLTSELSKWGKLASELITASLNTYLGKIIEVIDSNGGDVIKFLGDALLVSFRPNIPNEPHKHIALRAYTCVLQIMLKYPSTVINIKDIPRRESNQSKTAAVTDRRRSSQHEKLLQLHCAITCGRGWHVVVGDARRMDYFVDGEFLKELGDVLKAARKDEMSMSKTTYEYLVEYLPRIPQDSDIVVYRRDDYDLCWETISLKTPSSSLLYRDNTFVKVQTRQSSINRLNSPETPFSDPIEHFINSSMVHKLSAAKAIEKDRLERMNEYVSSSRGSSIRNTEDLNISYAEYRFVIVVFVKICFPAALEAVQKVVKTFIGCLEMYNGVFQQFSVDDKGQTLMACFGLPPHPIESGPSNSVLAVNKFIAMMNMESLGPFIISLSAGDLLFTKIGNDARSEASLLGDVVNTAARLLTVPTITEAIVCDKTLLPYISPILHVESLGMFWLKGKNEEVEVYKISPTQEFENIHGGPPLVGYVEQREKLQHEIEAWIRQEKSQSIITIMGKSGCGKSSLMALSCALFERAKISSCVTLGMEIRQSTPFFGIQTLMTYIYHKCLPRISNATDNISARVQSAITEIYELSLRRVSRTSVDLLSPVNRAAMASAGFKDAIEFLNFFGEEPKLAPLLLLVIPTLARDGETELGLGGQERTVKAVLRKFVQRIISKFMEMERTFFVFDDAQWLDAASLEVLEESIRVCPKVCFLFLFRPPEHEANSKLQELRHLKCGQHFELNGISQQELEALFIESVKMHRFIKIQAALVEEIYRLSGGNPLTSSMIIKSLSLDSSTLLVDEEGTLDIRGGKEAYDKLLSNSVGAAIMMQFDRLPPLFQRFLKFACILGQYFTLAEVQELSSDSTVTVKDFQTLIKTSDRFDFLRVENGNGKEMGEAYSFRHISVCKTIYESISFAERRNLHSLIATHYLGSLASQKRADVLPLVCFHLNQAGEVLRSIGYMEELCRNHMAHGLFPEGVGVASKLLESVLVEPLETVTLSPDMETKVDVDSAQLSLWFSMLAFCEARSSKILPGLRHASFALELIGEKLPTDLKEIQKETLKSILLQWKLFRKTKGGARRCVKPVITNFRIHREAISNALGALYFGSMFDKSYSKKRKGLILLKNLNFTIYNAVDFPEKWFEASLRSSMVLFALNGYLSDAYYRAALRAIPDPTLILDRYGVAYGLFLLYTNRCQRAIDLLQDSIRMYQENMDEIGRMGALFLKSTALFFRGVLNEPKELDFAAIHGIMRMEFIWSTSGGIALTRSYVFLDDLDALSQALELLDVVCVNAEKQLPNPENVTPNVMIRVFYIARRAIAESELELQKLKYSDIEDVLAKTHKSTQPEVLTWLKEISIRCSSVEFAFGGSGFAVLLTSIPVWILTTEFLVSPGSTCVAKKPRRMKKGRVNDVGHGTVKIFEEVFDRATLLAETAKEILFLSTKCLELSLGGKLIVMWLGHVISHALYMILRDDGVSLAFFKILRGALKRLSRLNDARAGVLGSDYQLFWAFIKALLGLYTLNTKEADGLLDDATRQFEGFSAMLLVKWLKRARLKETTVKF